MYKGFLYYKHVEGIICLKCAVLLYVYWLVSLPLLTECLIPTPFVFVAYVTCDLVTHPPVQLVRGLLPMVKLSQNGIHHPQHIETMLE